MNSPSGGSLENGTVSEKIIRIGRVGKQKGAPIFFSFINRKNKLERK